MEDDLLDWAAVLAFYFLFALFPAILFLAALSATLHLSSLVTVVLGMLSMNLPDSAAQLVTSGVSNLLQHHVPGLVSVGIILLMYSASQGFTALIQALDIIYEVRETRPYWKLWLIAAGLTWSSGLLAAVALAMVLLGRRFVVTVFGPTHAAGMIAILAPLVRWGVTMVCMVIALVVVYRVAPNARIRKGSVWPAAIIALVLWGVATVILAQYVDRFSPYGSLYGSLGAVIALMLWFYIVGLAILFGAEIHDEWVKMHGTEIELKTGGEHFHLRPRRPSRRVA